MSQAHNGSPLGEGSLDISGLELDTLVAIYDDLHRTLLQFIMSIKSVEETELFRVFKKVVRIAATERVRDNLEIDNNNVEPSAVAETVDAIVSVITRDHLAKTIVVMNRELAPLDLEIVSSLDQDDETHTILSFVNKKSTNSIKLSTSYTEKEIEIINQLIDEMFEAPFDNSETLTYSLKHSEALNIARKSLNTMLEAQNFITDLELNGWLETYNNNYTLSPRALAELQPFLVDRFDMRSPETPSGTISFCAGCNEMITRGLYCPKGDCYVRFHKSCHDLFVRSHNTEVCPNTSCGESLADMITFY